MPCRSLIESEGVSVALVSERGFGLFVRDGHTISTNRSNRHFEDYGWKL